MPAGPHSSVPQCLRPAVLQSFQPASGAWSCATSMQAGRSAERQAGYEVAKRNAAVQLRCKPQQVRCTKNRRQLTVVPSHPSTRPATKHTPPLFPFANMLHRAILCPLLTTLVHPRPASSHTPKTSQNVSLTPSANPPPAPFILTAKPTNHSTYPYFPHAPKLLYQFVLPETPHPASLFPIPRPRRHPANCPRPEARQNLFASFF